MLNPQNVYNRLQDLREVRMQPDPLVLQAIADQSRADATFGG